MSFQPRRTQRRHEARPAIMSDHAVAASIVPLRAISRSGRATLRFFFNGTTIFIPMLLRSFDTRHGLRKLISREAEQPRLRCVNGTPSYCRHYLFITTAFCGEAEKPAE